ncbi:hypothetical protein Nstercoris_01863 [Nitrosomonas stercoris]|uniref:Uncharacterized protein n=1 Tax=Nitrosomonas stercoris TaxID=1444684 RepID=A0A4Y1YR59_9PROT|nr:hypothetical protein Nstercoris_01863 [Nitrosomonas stercoris]
MEFNKKVPLLTLRRYLLCGVTTVILSFYFLTLVIAISIEVVFYTTGYDSLSIPNTIFRAS